MLKPLRQTTLCSESAGISDVGKKRRINQDVCYMNDGAGLYIVADGMGGQQAGDVASRVAVDTLLGWYGLEGRESCGFEQLPHQDSLLSEQADRLVAGIQAANSAVLEKARTHSHLAGMGTTMSAVRITCNTVIVANVGDSPVFLVRDGKIETLSVPHSLSAKCPADNELFGNAKHMLTRAVGVEEEVRVDSCEIQGYENDIVVLCSDGLSNVVQPDTIRQVAGDCSPDEACARLVELANENGGPDNITVVVVRINAMGPEKKHWFASLKKWFITGDQGLKRK